MKHSLNESGQTLIALLIFMLVAMTVTIAATAVAIINIQSNNGLSNGQTALITANSGIENALINIERNPSYTGGTMSLNNGTDTISVSGTGTLTIVSVATVGHFQRTVTATVTQTGSNINLSSWSETP
jgi:hypothetical protein